MIFQNSKCKDDFVKQPNMFPKQFVQIHDSWLAFDPIIGCKGSCVYCFLGPQGWQNKNPELLQDIGEAYACLTKYKFAVENDTSKSLADMPISIGNKTDMLHSDNLNYLKYILDLHEEEGELHPIVLITKQVIDKDLIDTLSKYPFNIYVLYSISFLPKKLEPNIPGYMQRMEAAKEVRNKIIKNNITNIHLIHYWRPIIDFMELDIDSIFRQIKTIFDCSICVGMYVPPEIEKFVESKKNKELYNYILKNKNKDNTIFEPSFSQLQSKAIGYRYPIFRHTSCAISFIQEKVDYNGSMWRTDFCYGCVSEQKERCETFKRDWKIMDYQSILDQSNDTYKLHDDCIEITNSISQERINYLTHRIGKPIFSKSVRNSIVWSSSNQIFFQNKYNNE
jgi:DNA repair photolyase